MDTFIEQFGSYPLLLPLTSDHFQHNLVEQLLLRSLFLEHANPVNNSSGLQRSEPLPLHWFGPSCHLVRSVKGSRWHHVFLKETEEDL